MQPRAARAALSGDDQGVEIAAGWITIGEDFGR
jgi:hypothetical protein